MPHAISWVEVPVNDFNRAKDFYSSILQAEIQEMTMGEYLMGMFPSDQGSVGGAICKGPDYVPSDKGTLVYLQAGDDLNTVLSRVEGAGGKVLVPKTVITPEYGFFALFIDTEGNKIGLHSQH